MDISQFLKDCITVKTAVFMIEHEINHGDLPNDAQMDALHEMALAAKTLISGGVE